MSKTDKQLPPPENGKVSLDGDTMDAVAGGGDDGWGPIFTITRPNGRTMWVRRRIGGGAEQRWSEDPRPKPKKGGK